ncbi:hypothetical protein DFH07DRAFT_784463 [Mycena maculata]|uniref:Uncharacterized protein n=1 Tax=Mycena maculata TaxID=230809 RepID=A0AAD7HGA5_9AGAR|nr:hypothetical protein DFH07DRAFT_784463 [Mycena maculata]
MKGKTHGHEEHASAVIDIKLGRSTTWKFPAEILGSTAEKLADRSGSSLRTEATIRGPRHRDGKEMEASCLAPREVRHGLCWQILSRDNTTVDDFLGMNNIYRGSSREYTMTRQPKKCAEMWTGIMESLSGQNGTTPATVDPTKISVKKREDGQFAQIMLPGEDHRIKGLFSIVGVLKDLELPPVKKDRVHYSRQQVYRKSFCLIWREFIKIWLELKDLLKYGSKPLLKKLDSRNEIRKCNRGACGSRSCMSNTKPADNILPNRNAKTHPE